MPTLLLGILERDRDIPMISRRKGFCVLLWFSWSLMESLEIMQLGVCKMSCYGRSFSSVWQGVWESESVL